MAGEKVIVSFVFESALVLFGNLGGHGGFPLGTVFLDLLLVVKLGVVVLSFASEALPDGKMLGVDGRSVVLLFAAFTDVLPAALLLLQIETGGIGKEEPGENDTSKTEPGDDVELLLRSDVVVKDGGEESTEFTGSGRDTVSGGTDGGREDFCGDEESDGVGTKLIEEGTQEVHGLELLDVFGRGVVVVLESGDHEENEAHQETDDLHPFAAVQLVVNQEGSQVVTNERNTDVAQVPKPGGHDGVGLRADDLDEF